MEQRPSSPPATGPDGSEQLQQRKRCSPSSAAPQVKHGTKRQRLSPEPSTQVAEEPGSSEQKVELFGNVVLDPTLPWFKEKTGESKNVAYIETKVRPQGCAAAVEGSNAPATKATDEVNGDEFCSTTVSDFEDDIVSDLRASSRQDELSMPPGGNFDTYETPLPLSATMTGQGKFDVAANLAINLQHTKVAMFLADDGQPDLLMADDNPYSRHIARGTKIEPDETIAAAVDQVMPDATITRADVYDHEDPMATSHHRAKARTSSSPSTLPEAVAYAQPQLPVVEKSMLQDELAREQEETETGRQKERIRKKLGLKAAPSGWENDKSDMPFPADKRSEVEAENPLQQEITHSVATSLNRRSTEADHDDSHARGDLNSTKDLVASKQKGADEAETNLARPGNDKMAQDNSKSVAVDTKKKNEPAQPSRRRSTRRSNPKPESETDDEPPAKSSSTSRRTRGAIPIAPVIGSDQEDNDDGGDFSHYSRSSSGRRASKRLRANTKTTALQTPAKVASDIRLLLSKHQASEKDIKSPNSVVNSNIAGTSNMETSANVLTPEPEAQEKIGDVIFVTDPGSIDGDIEHEAILDADPSDDQQNFAEQHVSSEDDQAASLNVLQDVVMTGLANPDDTHDPPHANLEKDITAQIDELKAILQSLEQDGGQLHPHAMAELHRYISAPCHQQRAHAGSEDLLEFFGSTDFPYSIHGSEHINQDDSGQWDYDDDQHQSFNQETSVDDFIFDTGTLNLDISNGSSSSLPIPRASATDSNIDPTLSANGLSATNPTTESSLHDFYKQDRELIKLAKPFVANFIVRTMKVRVRGLESLQNDSFEENGLNNKTAGHQEVIVLDETDDEHGDSQDHTRSNPAIMTKDRRHGRSGVSASASTSNGLDTTGASFPSSTRSTATSSSRRTSGNRSFTNVGGGTPSNKQQLKNRNSTTPTTAAGQLISQHGPDQLRYLLFPQDVTSEINLDRYLRDLGAEHLDKGGLKIDHLLKKKSWGCPWPQDEQQSLRDFVAQGRRNTSDPARGYSLMDGFPLVEDVAFVVPHNRADPDGDCYWRALSMSLHGDSRYYDLVKAEHLGYMHHVLDTPAHPRHGLYKGSLNSKLFVTSSPVAGAFQASLYQLLHMPHAWTPAAMQQVTADLYNVMLVTFSLDFDSVKVTEVSIRGAYNSRHIFMLFSEGCHYNPMFPNDFMPWEFRYPRPTVESTAGFTFAPKTQTKKEAWQHPWRVEFTKEVLPPVPRLHGCPVHKLRHYMKAK